jgi:hypothetical protein
VVVAVSVVGIVFATYGLLWSGADLLNYELARLGPPNMVNLVLTVMYQPTASSILHGTFRTALATMLAATAIGSLCMKRWGRRGMMWWAWISLFAVSVHFGIDVSQWTDRESLRCIIWVTYSICVIAIFDKPQIREAFGETAE